MLKHPVLRTPEFRRIDALPRRRIEDIDAPTLAKELTDALRRPWGTQSLRPIQALALQELALSGGMFGPMGVGSGKTLFSLLAPTVLESVRPVLIVPASLVEKTLRDKRALDAHWILSPDIKVLSYESLGIVSGADTLDRLDPDLLILDEAHRVRNRKAGVTRRVERFIDAHPGCRVVAISGTMVKKSIGDFAHLIDWVLKDRSPLPRSSGDLLTWVAALDADVNPLEMVPPGCLLDWATPEEVDQYGPVRAARLGFQRRLTETPGVVATRDESVSAGLFVRAMTYKVTPTTEAHFEVLRKDYATPDGWTFEEDALAWGSARQLALGLHYVTVSRAKWEAWPGRHKATNADLLRFIDTARPPQDWTNKRRDWSAFVRDVLSRSRSLDTPHHVELACLAGRLGRRELDAWRAVEKTFTPHSIEMWHDSAALEVCERWAKKPGIVWVDHVFFGRELARRTGLPYYANDGLDDQGRYIDDETGKHAIIASIAANATGRNLQHAFRRNLITAVPGASVMEQLIGRTHRAGQEADDVEVDVLMGCREAFESFQKALAGARMAQDTQGVSQKLLTATVDVPGYAEVKRAGGGKWRWERQAGREE